MRMPVFGDRTLPKRWHILWRRWRWRLGQALDTIGFSLIVFAASSFAAVLLWANLGGRNVGTLSDAFLAMVTFYYVTLTYGLLREAQRTRLSASESFVTATIDVNRTLLNFTVRNTGRGPARDVQIDTSPPLINQLGKRLNDYLTYSVLGPGQEMTYFFYHGPTLFESDVPKEYTITVSYFDVVTAETRRYSFTLDLRPFAGVQIASLRSPERDIAKYTKDIAMYAKDIANVLREKL